MARERSVSTERHHYVPRVYLKSFCSREGLVRLESIEDGRVFTPSLRNALVECGIYDIGDLPGLGSSESAGAVEDFLSQLENLFGKALSESLLNNTRPTPEQVIQMRTFVLAQAQRTPTAREVSIRVLEQEAKNFSSEMIPILENFGLSVVGTLVTANAMFSPYKVEVISTTERQPFISSDNPASHWLVYRGKWNDPNDGDTQKAILFEDLEATPRAEIQQLAAESNGHAFMAKSLMRRRRIICPLTPLHMMEISQEAHEQICFRPAGPREVQTWNKRIRRSARRVLILPPLELEVGHITRQ